MDQVKKSKPKFPTLNKRIITIVGGVLFLAILISSGIFGANIYFKLAEEKTFVSQNLDQANSQIASLSAELITLKAENEKLQNEDLRKTNKEILAQVKKVNDAYKIAHKIYIDLVDVRSISTKTGPFDSAFATILNYLFKEDFDNATKSAQKLEADLAKEKSRLATAVVIPANVPESNTAPGSGYARQKVTIDGNSYLVDIITADLSSTKVIVDTASDGTCTQDCPVLPLATYVSRSGAYAGINGTYFCPDTYPDCAGKKNTFDVLVMNKNKVYFNSDNNVYSNVPVAIFSGTSARFIPQSSGWGRDTSVDAVIANRPLLVFNGENMFGGAGEAKEGVKGNRSFLGSTDSKVYIGIVHGATVAESAKVLQTMGIKNAINLDSGGSSALWSGGYKAGPGRNLPNVVLFVKR